MTTVLKKEVCKIVKYLYQLALLSILTVNTRIQFNYLIYCLKPTSTVLVHTP